MLPTYATRIALKVNNARNANRVCLAAVCKPAFREVEHPKSPLSRSLWFRHLGAVWLILQLYLDVHHSGEGLYRTAYKSHEQVQRKHPSLNGGFGLCKGNGFCGVFLEGRALKKFTPCWLLRSKDIHSCTGFINPRLQLGQDRKDFVETGGFGEVHIPHRLIVPT